MPRILQAAALLFCFTLAGCGQSEALKIQKYESAVKELESLQNTKAEIHDAKVLALKIDDKEAFARLKATEDDYNAAIDKLRTFVRENRPKHLETSE